MKFKYNRSITSPAFRKSARDAENHLFDAVTKYVMVSPRGLTYVINMGYDQSSGDVS